MKRFIFTKVFISLRLPTLCMPDLLSSNIPQHLTKADCERECQNSCYLPPVQGPCKNFRQRVFYNHVTGNCEVRKIVIKHSERNESNICSKLGPLFSHMLKILVTSSRRIFENHYLCESDDSAQL